MDKNQIIKKEKESLTSIYGKTIVKQTKDYMFIQVK